MTVRNYTPYARPSFNGEHRPMNPAPAEWIEVGEPRLPGWTRALIIVAGSGIGWGVVAGLVLMAVELAR